MTVYILLEKDLMSETVSVHGVYDTLKLAQEVMEEQMSLWEEFAAFKIEAQTLNQR